jgi:DNA-binding response OmpR family regulator
VEIDSPICPAHLENWVQPPETAAGVPRRVLVVDDDAEMRSLLEEALEEQGYLVHGAGDTLSALIHLHAHPVDVLVLDWKMPDLDGFVLLQCARRILPGLPVIFITAHNLPEVHRRALEGGAFGFLAKPFPVRLLLAEIQGAILAGAGIRRSAGEGLPETV